jgi:hypothetical protein
MERKEERNMALTRADIVFFKRGCCGYRAYPPTFFAHRTTNPVVTILNLTGHLVRVFFPKDVLRPEKSTEIANGELGTFRVNYELDSGSYVYVAYVDGTNQLVEGNSPPEIIIDK